MSKPIPYRLRIAQFEGADYTLEDLAAHLGWPLSTVIRRYKRGQAMEIPLRKPALTKYKYRSKWLTVSGIVKESGLAASSVRYRIKRGIPLDSPVAETGSKLTTLLFDYRGYKRVPLTYITHTTRLSIDLMRARLKRGMPPHEQPGGAFYNPGVLLPDSPTAKIKLRHWGYIL